MDIRLVSQPDRDEYFRKVWEIVRKIPSGRVCTYGQIAQMIPPPEGVDPDDYEIYKARWVGDAMSRSPAGVPWQRVINAAGKISPRNGPPQLQQRELLESEGVVFDAHGRVDLARFGWTGPDPS